MLHKLAWPMPDAKEGGGQKGKEVMDPQERECVDDLEEQEEEIGPRKQ